MSDRLKGPCKKRIDVRSIPRGRVLVQICWVSRRSSTSRPPAGYAWAVLLFFCGFGLMSSGHAMSLVAVFAGACAAASAVYMILDLSSPYSGVFRVSPAPLQQVLAVMGKE